MVTISGSESMTYTVDVPSQGENTFASFLMYVQTPDVAVMVSDVRIVDGPEAPDPTLADFREAFGGAVIGEGGTYTFPTGADSWGGFANMNTALYPLSFPAGGKITFIGSVASGGSADVRFRFEFKPYPDTEPSYNTESVTVSGSTAAEYVIDIPLQGNKTFESFLMYVDTPDVPVTVTSILVTAFDPVTDADLDGDGVDDADDAFPSDPAASVDTDGDGMPDDWNEGATQAEIDASTLMVDEDDDGDGVPDIADPDPLDPSVFDASLADFSEASGGAVAEEGGTYTVPTGAEPWAGFANMNTALYPLSFSEAAHISFTASVPSGGSADIYFRFEKNPHPDTEPSYNTAPVTISGSESMTYTVDVPSQGENTFASFLMYVQTPDVAVMVSDVRIVDGPAPDSLVAVFTGNFGGFEVDGDTYTFPTGAESWAGVANTNVDLYPLHFPEGGEVRFRAAIPEGGADTSINFKFERLPYPDTEPSFFTDNAVISGPERDYVITIPQQDASNTFSSILMFIVERDQPVMLKEIRVEAYEVSPGPVDTDRDGVDDADDAFPTDPAASVDTDGDGMPDDWNEGATQAEIDASTLMVDEDDDGDGVPDIADPDPLDPSVFDASPQTLAVAFAGQWLQREVLIPSRRVLSLGLVLPT